MTILRVRALPAAQYPEINLIIDMLVPEAEAAGTVGKAGNATAANQTSAQQHEKLNGTASA